MDIQEIRASRSRGVVIFAKFCQERRRHKECLFCFFEGEDSKYYGSRIEKYTNYSYENTINYNCGGRKEVLKAYQLISSKPEYADTNMMFFIDRDYTPLEKALNNVFQTPCYSIENFYTSSSCFSRFIVREFGINPIDEDYRMCVDDYMKRQKEFHTETLYLNAWLSCQRKAEEKYGLKRIILADYKVSKLFSTISIDQVTVKQAINVELLNQHFPNAYGVSEGDLATELDFYSNSDCQQLFRGKFELEFLRKIVESLKSKNRENTYFHVHYNCVYADVNVNTLSTLSEYADTPECLIDFLRNHQHAVL